MNEKYVVPQETIDQLITETMDELESRNYSPSRDAIAKICDDMYGNSEHEGCKSELLAILSKHPNFNAEKLRVEMGAEKYTRPFCCEAVVDFAKRLRDRICMVVGQRKQAIATDFEASNGAMSLDDFNAALEAEDRKTWHLYDFVDFCYAIKQQFFTEDVMRTAVDDVNRVNPAYHIRTNMKASKAILKIAKEEGWNTCGLETKRWRDDNGVEREREYDWWEKNYAEMCDAINPVTFERPTYISLNLLDFLLMSHGNGWRSCHNIAYCGDDDMGGWSSGTLSYARARDMFVFYTVRESDVYDDHIELREKLTRQMFGFHDGTLFQSRMYPQNMDYGAEEAYAETRAIVQKVFAECLSEPNLWDITHDRESKLRKTLIKTESGFTAYPDWRPGNPGSTHITFSKLKGKPEYSALEVAVLPRCIRSGAIHDYCECIDRDGAYEYYCDECGDGLDRDDAEFDENGNCLCENCRWWCDACEEYHSIGSERNAANYLNSWGNRREIDVCDYWIDNRYYYCEECDELWHEGDLTIIDDRSLCPTCYDELVAACEYSGEEHLKENMTEVEDDLYVYNEYLDEYYEGRTTETESEVG